MWMTFFFLSAPRTPRVVLALRRSIKSSECRLAVKKPHLIAINHTFSLRIWMSSKKIREKINFPFPFCNEAQMTTTGLHVWKKTNKQKKTHQKKSTWNGRQKYTTRGPRRIAKQIVIPTQFLNFIVYPHFKNSSPWTNKGVQNIFSFKSLILFLSSKKYSAKSKEDSERFPLSTSDSHLKILNSLGVKNVTRGYMNVFDWLVNQLTSKQDRKFAMIGQ